MLYQVRINADDISSIVLQHILEAQNAELMSQYEAFSEYCLEAEFAETENDNWQEKQVLTPDRYQSKGRFGFSVSIHGNILAVGYPGYDQKGLIEIYHLNEDKWSKQQTLTNPDEVVESYFGSDISLEDNYLVTGHYNGEKAFLYINDGQSFNLKNGIESPVADEGKFGRSLAIKGDQMIIAVSYTHLTLPTILIV